MVLLNRRRCFLAVDGSFSYAPERIQSGLRGRGQVETETDDTSLRTFRSIQPVVSFGFDPFLRTIDVDLRAGSADNARGAMQRLTFQLLARDGAARRGEIVTRHGTIQTPVFMPVGTLASVKSLTTDQLRQLGPEIILNNTYHLMLRPGIDMLEQLGGVHRFMNWDRAVLSDSGGFQVF